ncbi:methyltransferase family protein [Catelliglobosispora koreensis]|uniref:methyltransferase family protein n=1 Tax=Catelliglobosispora koreensis TaxID=129052 RepID=UPI0003815B45|nr:isoprenylcysteine carboxylmethyltransferase family protein [Catelliglobosispora koreensis]
MPGLIQRLSNIPLPEPNLTAIAIGIALHRVRPWTPPGPKAIHRLAGGLLIAVGAGVIARSWQAAGQVRLANPGALITSGPYAVSRNPMYIGWSLLQLGIGLASRTTWIVATLPPAALWIHRQVVGEERRLTDAFGDDYTQYRRSTPRYLPPR